MIILSRNLSGLIFCFSNTYRTFGETKKQYSYESTFYFIFLAALFIAGNMIAIESTDRVERKLPVVLKGEVPTTTHRSIPVIPISASVSTDDNIVEIIFTAPLGEVKILVDGQVQEVCQVTAPGQTTSFSIEGWAPGVYKLEFKIAGGGYVYGELIIE